MISTTHLHLYDEKNVDARIERQDIGWDHETFTLGFRYKGGSLNMILTAEQLNSLKNLITTYETEVDWYVDNKEAGRFEKVDGLL